MISHVKSGSSSFVDADRLPLFDICPSVCTDIQMDSFGVFEVRSSGIVTNISEFSSFERQFLLQCLQLYLNHWSK